MGAVVFAGAVMAPFVVFVAPVARLYWLITGRRLPGPLGRWTPASYIVVIPFEDVPPAQVRHLREQPEHNPEPAMHTPRWLRVWTRVAGILLWQPPGRRQGRW